MAYTGGDVGWFGTGRNNPRAAHPGVAICWFLGCIPQPGRTRSHARGVLGSAVTVWVTFIPCFLFTFLGAPYVEALRGNKSLKTAMSSITAAVVGVVLNLAIWFALNTIFGKVESYHTLGMSVLVPVWNTLNVPGLFITTLAILAIFRFKLSVITTIVCSAGLGILYNFIK